MRTTCKGSVKPEKGYNKTLGKVTVKPEGSPDWAQSFPDSNPERKRALCWMWVYTVGWGCYIWFECRNLSPRRGSVVCFTGNIKKSNLVLLWLFTQIEISFMRSWRGAQWTYTHIYISLGPVSTTNPHGAFSLSKVISYVSSLRNKQETHWRIRIGFRKKHARIHTNAVTHTRVTLYHEADSLLALFLARNALSLARPHDAAFAGPCRKLWPHFPFRVTTHFTPYSFHSLAGEEQELPLHYQQEKKKYMS